MLPLAADLYASCVSSAEFDGRHWTVEAVLSRRPKQVHENSAEKEPTLAVGLVRV